MAPAWNQGRSIGQMRPLTPEQVRTIRSLLDTKGSLRDIALFETAIDTMLRAVDLLRLQVATVTSHGSAVAVEFNIQQQKTRQGVRVSLSTRTRDTLGKWIKQSGKGANDHLFTSLRRSVKAGPITREAYRLLVKSWVTSAGLDPALYSTHSLRRTKAAYLYERTQNVEAVRLLLGQSSVAATSHYLGLEESDALAIARRFEM